MIRNSSIVNNSSRQRSDDEANANINNHYNDNNNSNKRRRTLSGPRKRMHDESISMEDNDNAVPVKSRILIQPDWHEGPSSWLMVKTPGQPSHRGVYDDGKVGGSATDDDNGGFSVAKHRSTLISVSHPRAGYTALFVAPSAVWPRIHEKGGVVSLDVTDGGLGVSSSSTGDLHVWTTNNGEVRRRLEGHIDAVYTTCFFPSGTVILSGGADFRVKIWSAESGKCAATLVGHRGGVNDLAIVERGRNVISAGNDGVVKLWDVGRSACLYSFDELGIGVVNGVSLGTADRRSGGEASAGEDQREVGTEGKFLIVAGEGSGSGVGNGDAAGGKVAGLVLQSREKFFELPTPSPVNACLALDDRTFAYGLQDGTLAVADVRNLRASLHVDRESRGAILNLRPFRSGGVLVSTQDGSTFYVPSKVYSSASPAEGGQGQTVMELTGPDSDPVYRVATQGRNVIYTACRDGSVRKYLIDDDLVGNVES